MRLRATSRGAADEFDVRQAHIGCVVKDFAVFDHDENGVAVAHLDFVRHCKLDIDDGPGFNGFWYGVRVEHRRRITAITILHFSKALENAESFLRHICSFEFLQSLCSFIQKPFKFRFRKPAEMSSNALQLSHSDIRINVGVGRETKEFDVFKDDFCELFHSGRKYCFFRDEPQTVLGFA
jgi:hypothetical protein